MSTLLFWLERIKQLGMLYLKIGYFINELSEIIPIIFYAFYFKNKEFELKKLVFLFVLLKIVFTYIQSILIYTAPASFNIQYIPMIQNSYLVLSFFIISLIYKKLFNPKLDKLIAGGIIVFFIVLIINFLEVGFKNELLNYGVSVSNLIFTTYGIIYFYQSDGSKKSVFSRKYFWLNTALLTYNSLMFSSMAVSNLFINDKRVMIHFAMWSFVLFASILFNVLISIFIVKTGKLPAYKLDSRLIQNN
jgi:hypothetical protein